MYRSILSCSVVSVVLSVCPIPIFTLHRQRRRHVHESAAVRRLPRPGHYPRRRRLLHGLDDVHQFARLGGVAFEGLGQLDDDQYRVIGSKATRGKI